MEHDDLMEVLRKEIEARERLKGTAPERKETQDRPTSGEALNVGGPTCSYCRGNHFADRCRVVTNVANRKKKLMKDGRCFRCLTVGHLSSKCPNSKVCYKCKGKHHTSICERKETNKKENHDGQDSKQTDETKDSKGSTGEEDKTPSSGSHISIDRRSRDAAEILMKTASVTATSPTNWRLKTTCKLLMDDGCQRTYISKCLKEKLQLETVGTEYFSVSVFGGKRLEPKNHEIVKLAIEGRNRGSKVNFEAVVVDEVCSLIPPDDVGKVAEQYDHLDGLELADGWMDFVEFSGINILVGLDNYYKIAGKQVIFGKRNEPVAMETKFGYVVSGTHYTSGHRSQANISTYSFFVKPSQAIQISPNDFNEDKRLSDVVEKFWELETTGLDEICDVEEEVMRKVQFDGERYVVPLPWKEDHPLLPDNYRMAEKRLGLLWKRLKRDPDLMMKYSEVICEQEKRGIIEKVSPEDDQIVGNCFYLSHSPVIRNDKTSTKVRVVFDASAKVDGVSLNSCLHAGPSHYTDLFGVLARFRFHKIGVVADIEKAFLSVGVRSEDRDVLRFLWIDESEKMITYRFKRVCFGVNSSMFLLKAAIKTHLKSEE